MIDDDNSGEISAIKERKWKLKYPKETFPSVFSSNTNPT
jgi:hypothetical protein